MRAGTIAIAATIGAAAVTTLAGVALGRRVVMPGRPKYVRVVAVTADELTLESNPDTRHAGEFGVWFNDDHGHARIGEVVSQDAQAKTVTRKILAVTGGDLRSAAMVRWSGHVFARPTDLHPAAREVDMPVEGGVAPAWVIPSTSEEQQATWAIHVHGIRTTRITALRSVPAAQLLGYTSLVPSFRGDGEGPQTQRNASTLGQTEWRDIDSAIGYAIEHGAEKVVLFGWSMGASVVLLSAERAVHRAAVAALVLISPVTEWRTAIRAGAARAHLPQALGSLAALFLSWAPLSRLTGLPAPIDFNTLDWTIHRRLNTPTLVIHSDGDTEIPLSLTQRFAAAHPSRVDLVEIPNAAHAWEFNVAPDRFNGAITEWLSARETAAR
ncbi:alpha/beta fold hydrolase [Microbacteriaceae bacterium VKM Ac-2855]|nr:alpha/beta fold hydrolase [Microbacteriaceae bacterium VKM Ac-2855]